MTKRTTVTKNGRIGDVPRNSNKFRVEFTGKKPVRWTLGSNSSKELGRDQVKNNVKNEVSLLVLDFTS